MTLRSARRTTAAVIFFAALVTLAWDVYVYIDTGIHSTISQVLTDWIGSKSAVPAIGIGFLCGIMFCHLCGWIMIPTGTLKRLAAEEEENERKRVAKKAADKSSKEAGGRKA